MQRRRFLQSLTALTIAPVMPGLPAASTAGHSTIQLVWATYYAQMNNACSAAEIASALNVSPAVAQSLFAKLVARNIVTAPGLTGVSRAVRPMLNGWQAGGIQQTTSIAAKNIRFDAARLMAQITRNIDREYPAGPSNWRPRQDSNLQPAP